jgi:secondary thiamine-phosphate synthase enzyme
MMYYTTQLDLDTAGHFSVVNVTEKVREFLKSTGVQHGQVLVFYKHTTGAVLVAEHEAGIIADLQDMFERVAPVSHTYKHHLKEVDFNGHAHVRSALMTISVTIPVQNGDLLLGYHQEILVIDDQTEISPRQLAVQVSGE